MNPDPAGLHLNFSPGRGSRLALRDSTWLPKDIWESPKIRGTLLWGPYNKDPTI